MDLVRDGARAGRREWVGLAVLGLPTLLVSLDIGALFLALPHLTADLGASGIEQLWITDIYGFLLAGLLITMGRLGDRIGRRRLLLVGAALFGALSVLAAYSTSPAMLVAARALLGVAGATLMPSTLALITNMFRDARQRGVAIAAWVSCMMVGAAIGPVVGGALLERFWWGSVFLLGVPVMVLLLLVGPFLLPEFRDPHAGTMDLVSVALSLLGVLPFIYGLKELTVAPGGSPVVPVVAVVAGVASLAAFVRRQRHLEHPLIDVSLFRVRAFRTTVVAMTLASGAMAGTFLLTSQYMQSVVGLSPGRAGLWLMSTGLAIAVGSQIAPKLAAVLPLGSALGLCLTFGAVGFVLISLAGPVDGLVLVVVGLAIVHLGAGPLFALGAGVVMSSSPPERAGSAASISETANHFGTTLGMAVLGTLGSFVYRTEISATMPAGVHAEAALAATQTVSGSSVAAGDLAPSVSDELRRAAGEAFTTGLNLTAVVGTALFAVLAAAIYAAHKGTDTAAPPVGAADTGDSHAPT